MNVEQENCFFAIFASVQRRRRWSGTSCVIAWAKSALITSASARYSPCVGPHADRPPAVEQDLLHLLAERERHAQLARRRGPSPRDTAAQPPIGCQTPYSYSRNDRIENRLGQLNGDMPRYFDWNENASRMRGSGK